MPLPTSAPDYSDEEFIPRQNEYMEKHPMTPTMDNVYNRNNAVLSFMHEHTHNKFHPMPPSPWTDTMMHPNFDESVNSEITSVMTESAPPSLDVYLPATKHRRKEYENGRQKFHDAINRCRWPSQNFVQPNPNPGFIDIERDSIAIFNQDIPGPRLVDRNRRDFGRGTESPLVSFPQQMNAPSQLGKETNSTVTPLGVQNVTPTHQNMSPCSSRQLSVGDLNFTKDNGRKRAFDVDGDHTKDIRCDKVPQIGQSGSINQSERSAEKEGSGKDMYDGGNGGESRRRCGRKSMNYSSEQKRERNRAAVKKCRQRQALKYEYLQRKAEALESENQALSDMLVNNIELDQEKRHSLTRGIQMDILLKIKEIFTQSLPKDFVIDADSIWGLNSVLAVSMPSRCYYGIESIKDFWRTSLRMRNKGKIRSFWAWLFRLPPGDRFSEFSIEPFSPNSSLYFIYWRTKSVPSLSGSMVIMFGRSHRVTLHVECFGWLIWRYLLTNQPFPEPPLEDHTLTKGR
uniref:Uncharacterized protein AlNc14C435G11620 n=1 Tax=Albugo laibachii Nc14 TaxID=890382 RepID=F0WZM8_9STRA|nr:conserved hypothetical protein [Albugo laibachii Nc14]|eukprot:CCA26953.1 conserved hypothetical protein [Albugo laibachii Nc14]